MRRLCIKSRWYGFENDIVAFADSVERLQQMIEGLQTTYLKISLEVNQEKIKLMTNRNTTTIKLNNVNLISVIQMQEIKKINRCINKDWNSFLKNKSILISNIFRR